MCSVCLQNPCDSRCPNAPEPDPIYECDKCGCGIFQGEKFFDGPDGYICKKCIDEMTAEEILEMIGENFRTAEKEEW